MGVYYMVVNVDKKEALSPHDFDYGAKMAEWCYQGNEMVLALHNLLTDRWKGDRVYVVSDDLADVDDDYSKALAEARKELGVRSLYRFACEQCTELQPDEVDTADHDIRYIYNHALKVFVDMEHCPKYTDWISPLPLLIALGHDGPGGGNFDFEDDEDMEDAVGSWCDTVSSIELRTKPLEGVEYREIQPGFTEEPPGRYYYIVNVDKRKLFGAYDLQLLSWSCHQCEMVYILHNLFAEEWKGDRVYVVAHDALNGWEFPGNEALCEELAQSEEKGLFFYAEKHFERLGTDDVEIEDQGIRYLYNHALREYVDLKHCPVREEDDDCIAPLPLLLTIGNVGDVELDLMPEDGGFEHMGKWCATVRSIEVSKEPLPGVDYPEFRPDFLQK
ncbi:hypothetical protein [uncultured Desulfovibrio sp.]|uniref:hypothetical protein n=1 Tax=uncultured Desulfovibrio sp. TaxID=167968 RepID=UPI002617B74A|nr:hypothetical protein [uncultured Desulfovibrio sp.]